MRMFRKIIFHDLRSFFAFFTSDPAANENVWENIFLRFDHCFRYENVQSAANENVWENNFS